MGFKRFKCLTIPVQMALQKRKRFKFQVVPDAHLSIESESSK